MSNGKSVMIAAAAIACCACFAAGVASADETPEVAFHEEPGKVLITVGGERFATYVYEDERIWRPYFAHVRAPGGVQVTRNHPPQKDDFQDHADLHPGLFLGLRDLSGHEYWKARGKVVGGDFIQKPRGGPGRGTFAVRNRYLSADGGTTVCREECRYTISVRPAGYLIVCDSVFTPGAKGLYFGDEEEMGLAVRVATPLAVKSQQGGHITDAEGRVDEENVWGKQADWCDYSGTLKGQYVGVTLMPDPNTFRRCWWHARDYGFLVANPFGRHAFTGESKSKIEVKPGESLRLRFGAMIHGHAKPAQYDPALAYADFLKQIGE